MLLTYLLYSSTVHSSSRALLNKELMNEPQPRIPSMIRIKYFRDRSGLDSFGIVNNNNNSSATKYLVKGFIGTKDMNA